MNLLTKLNARLSESRLELVVSIVEADVKFVVLLKINSLLLQKISVDLDLGLSSIEVDHAPLCLDRFCIGIRV